MCSTGVHQDTQLINLTALPKLYDANKLTTSNMFKEENYILYFCQPPYVY